MFTSRAWRRYRRLRLLRRHALRPEPRDKPKGRHCEHDCEYLFHSHRFCPDVLAPTAAGVASVACVKKVVIVNAPFTEVPDVM